MTRHARHAWAGTTCLVTAALLAGCTSSAPTAPTTPTHPAATARRTATEPTTPPVSTSALARSTTVAPAAPTPTPPRSTSAAPSTPTAAAAPRSTCTSVQIRVIRGSASQGEEFAALQFTNTGAASCALYGYPSVTLLRGGKAIGRAAQPSGATLSHRELAPGATAESQLHDYTTCSAALSDSLRVGVPGSSQSAVRPAELRACALRVDPLAAPE